MGQWGWATVYTMSDVPIYSNMTDVERERLWWLPHELLQFKENYREVQAGLDDKRKGSFARLFASRNVMKLQANGYGQPLNPIEVSNMLHKINGYTLRSALKRAADLMNDLQRIRQFDCDEGLDESVCSTRSKSHYKRSLSLDSIDEAKHSLLNAAIHTRSVPRHHGISVECNAQDFRRTFTPINRSKLHFGPSTPQQKATKNH